MKKCLYYIGIVFLFSCKKHYEESTMIDVELTNFTTHTIQITPYSGGVPLQNFSSELMPGESKNIAHNHSLGKKALGTGFYSDYLSTADSVVVTFDHQYHITHYFNNVLQFASRYYVYDSHKNILNIKSYEGVIKSENKYSIYILYTFPFREQNYLDAQ